jgi:hypothetical protein
VLCPVWLLSAVPLISFFPCTFLRYSLSDSEMVPVAPYYYRYQFCFHIPHVLNLYFRIFSASFVIAFLLILLLLLLVEALYEDPEGHFFDARWCHWNFFIVIHLLAARIPWGVSNRNEYQEYFLGVKWRPVREVNDLTNFMWTFF